MVIEVKDNNNNVLASATYNTASDYVDAGITKTIASNIYVQQFSGATKVTATTQINSNRDQALITGTDTQTVAISASPPL